MPRIEQLISGVWKSVGSSVLYSDAWVLTAWHNLEPVDAKYRVVFGSQPPRDVVWRNVFRFPDSLSDAAFIKVRTPFTTAAGATHPFSNLTSPSAMVTAFPKVKCLGYNSTTALRYDEFEITTAGTFPLTAHTPGTNGGNLVYGDSGGPCFPGLSANAEVLAIDRGEVSAGSERLEPVTVFGPMFQKIAGALDAFQIDLDNDGMPETFIISCDGNGWFRFDQLFKDGSTFPIHTVAGCGGSVTKSLSGGRFAFDAQSQTGNPLRDVLVTLAGVPLYFEGIAGPPYLSAKVFDFGGQYDSFSVTDLDGDGYDDAEGVQPDGRRFVFKGSSSGLQPGREVLGLPTADGDDGRFLTLTGPGLQTPIYESTSIYFGVPPGEEFQVDVFDGDESGLNDKGDGTTCFQLYSDKDQSGNFDVSIPTGTSQQFGGTYFTDQTFFADADNHWKPIYKGPNQGPVGYGGWYIYRMDIRFGSGDCSALAPSNTGAENAFKVRIGGGVSWLQSTQWAFIARDGVGDWSKVAAPAADNTFDGTFTFWLPTWTENTEVIVDDEDADYTKDSDHEGDAVGKSDVIQYAFTRWYQPTDASSWETLDLPQCTNTDPSGNQEAESWTCAIPNDPSWYDQRVEWTWSDVYTENNIRVDQTVGSPGTYAVFGNPPPIQGLPPTTSATSKSTWIGAPSAIAGLLPIVLGEGVAQGTIDSISAALATLRGEYPSGKVLICHVPPGNPSNTHAIWVSPHAVNAHLAHGDDMRRPEVQAGLKAELLATLLNIARAEQRGENLLAAHLYANATTVSELIASANAALTTTDALCSISAASEGEMARLTMLLAAVNQGKVSYAPLSGTQAQSMRRRLFLPLLHPVLQPE